MQEQNPTQKVGFPVLSPDVWPKGFVFSGLDPPVPTSSLLYKTNLLSAREV